MGTNIDFQNRKFKNIVVLTGAGISKESGIDTFRDKDGLWTKVNLEDVATPEGFYKNPKYVNEFYNIRRKELLSGNIKPNLAHIALAEFEKKWNNEFLLVTQNIDNLHEMAGSQKLLHMHGELLKASCIKCHAYFDWYEDITLESECKKCKRKNCLRPYVVWFGEQPLFLSKIYSALSKCDLFVSIGTSGSVYPAASFVSIAKDVGATTVELNLEPSANASYFDFALYGKATEVVPKFLNILAISHNL